MLRCLNKLDENMLIFAADTAAMHHTVNTKKGITLLTLEHDD